MISQICYRKSNKYSPYKNPTVNSQGEIEPAKELQTVLKASSAVQSIIHNRIRPV